MRVLPLGGGSAARLGFSGARRGSAEPTAECVIAGSDKMQFLEKLAEIENKYEELTARLGDPKVLADAALYPKTAKAHSELREIVEKYRQWKEIDKDMAETRTLLEESTPDPAMKALAQ